MNRYFKIITGLVVIGLILFFLYSIAALVKIIIISALFAYILDPIASALEARGLKRTVSTFIVFSFIVAFLVGFVLLILPIVSSEIQAIQDGLSTGKAKTIFMNFEKTIQSRLEFVGIREMNISDKIETYLSGFGNQIFSYVMNIVSLITNLVIIPFIMFFLIKDGRELKKNIISLIPNRYFEFSLNVLHKMDIQLGNYLRGQFLDALIIGILSIGALWILGVNYFFMIGAFAGLANLIPYIGPIAGAVPAIIVSIMQTGSFTLVPWIVLAFTIVQLLDNVLVQPLVVAKTVNLHPLLVLLVVIIGGQFFGILGMLLAVPATGVVKVISHETYYSYKQYRFD